jgi:hypothetical protein
MCYILCMCVCVGASDTTTASDDPFTFFWAAIFSGFCSGRFPRGVLGGAGMPPPWLREAFDIGR